MGNLREFMLKKGNTKRSSPPVGAKGNAYDTANYPILKETLFHHLQQILQRIEVARVGIHVEDVAVAVDEFVGGVAVHAKEALDGYLLLGGEVVVHHVVARHIVLLDDILPRLLTGAVGEVEVYDVVVLQMLVFLLAFR